MLNFLKIASQHVVPQHLITRFVGCLAHTKINWLKNFFISWFVKTYKVDMNDAQEINPLAFDCFHDFFIRPLKPDARAICQAPNEIASPVDGTISQLGAIDNKQLLQAKGHTYTLSDLLADDEQLAQQFQNGHFATIYLAPKDYHRVHMPFTGRLRKMIYVPGRLFSVNPLTTANVKNLFARNERVVCVFDTELGPMSVILVGALIVGSMATQWAGQITPAKPRQISVTEYQGDDAITLEKGAELGYFSLGSTVIVLFGPNHMQWQAELAADVSVRLGQLLGNKTIVQ